MEIKAFVKLVSKSHVLPFKISESHDTSPLDLVHIDLWGPSSTISASRFRYYVLFLDDYSRYNLVFPLKNRETLNTFKQFKVLVETQFERKIKVLQSDWGGEFRNFT